MTDNAALKNKVAQLNQAEEACKKAVAALNRFDAKGPHSKKKSGRPGFWKSPEGALFVQEVDYIVEECKKRGRNISLKAAIEEVRKKTSELSKWAKTDDGLNRSLSARVARLGNLRGRGAEVRYQEAKRYWRFSLNPDEHEKEREILERKVRESLAVWRSLTRNPYDFT